MKPKKPRRVVPLPGGSVTYRTESTGPPIYQVPLTGKPTRMKYDREKGMYIIDPDHQQPIAETPSGASDEPK